MRILIALPVAAAFALAACGSEEASGEDVSVDDMVEQFSDAQTPAPGEYRASVEILEFNVPGMDEEFGDMFRGMFESEAMQNVTSCITPEQSATAREDMLKAMGQGDCNVVSFDSSDTSINAVLECAMEEGVTSTVTMAGTMTTTGADMEVSTVMPMPGMGDVNIRMRTTSERIGDCS